MRADDFLDAGHAEYAGALAGVEMLGGDVDGPAPILSAPAAASARGRAGAEAGGPSAWEQGAALVEGEAPPDDGIALI